MTALNILSFVLILMGLILVHEAGHMVVAKLCGMRVERFSIFFGKPIWSFRRGETEYGIGWLPLGGYVKISGMARGEEVPPEVEPRAYYAQPAWKKVATILAGPAVNVAVAFLAFAGVFWIGGIPTDRSTNAVAAVAVQSPASSIGLQRGDRILSVNGVAAGSRDFRAIQRELRGHPNQIVTVRFRHAGQAPVSRDVRLTQGRLPDGRKIGLLGFSPEPVYKAAGPIGGITAAWDFTKYITEQQAKGIGRLFTSSKARSEINSIVGTGAVYNEISSQGGLTVLRFVGIISLILAVMNLLPLLPLDGGHILFALLERLKGSAIKREVYERASFVGIALFLIVFVIALQNDITRITGSGFTSP